MPRSKATYQRLGDPKAAEKARKKAESTAKKEQKARAKAAATEQKVERKAAATQKKQAKKEVKKEDKAVTNLPGAGQYVLSAASGRSGVSPDTYKKDLAARRKALADKIGSSKSAKQRTLVSYKAFEKRGPGPYKAEHAVGGKFDHPKRGQVYHTKTGTGVKAVYHEYER